MKYYTESFNSSIYYTPIHEVDQDYLSEIKESLLNNGWNGMPILVTDDNLVTGCHRYAALREIYEDIISSDDNWMLSEEEINGIFDFSKVEFVDVTDILQAYFDKHNDGEWERIEYDCLSQYFAGTWVEEFKDQLIEW